MSKRSDVFVEKGDIRLCFIGDFNMNSLMTFAARASMVTLCYGHEKGFSLKYGANVNRTVVVERKLYLRRRRQGGHVHEYS